MDIQQLLYYDAKDYELLSVVNRFLERDTLVPQEETQRFFYTALHPKGIKELAVSQEIRVAYAVINLLDTLEAGQGRDRIIALHALHDEVLSASASSFRHNTGRVLIQIMKGLVRARGDQQEQLRLAHDFRRAASGRQRIIRRMLRRYHLLEMPEAWNQVSFDHHVHDANTKGRKSPTHLIMDAWIKGIRALNVLYYNYVEPSAVEELLQAARIMDVTVHIGVEFQAHFRGRHVQFIWEPRGFTDHQDMLAFLDEKPTRHLMRMGREASLYYHQYVLDLLACYNTQLRYALGKQLGLSLGEIEEQEILALVGIGQTSRIHLAELIYRHIRQVFAPEFAAMRSAWDAAAPTEKNSMQARVDSINALSPDSILKDWLTPAEMQNFCLPQFAHDGQNTPEILRLLPVTLIDWLVSIRPSSNIVLNLRDLTAEDVLELLYEGEGLITHLELYNLKNALSGQLEGLEAISALQNAINEGSTIALKRLIKDIVRSYGCAGSADATGRCSLFMEILRNIPRLQSYYVLRPLRTRIGSDSTSRSLRIHGMGFVLPETLPPQANRALRGKHSQRMFIPLEQEVNFCITYSPKRHLPLGKGLSRFIRRLPGLHGFGMIREESWKVNEKLVHYNPQGNIATLGGFQKDARTDFCFTPPDNVVKPPPFAYMNTTLKNICKVVFGFTLAMATFLYTQDWWFLAWFGPVIWFSITGFRNIVQATLGGGGIRRTPLLRWNDYISWSRLCDSLMYTGMSVPLLELGVRWFFMGKVLNITAMTSPIVFFTVISVVNGAYLAGHNIFRGLPKEAVIGNLFRSVLAIPVSIAYNFVGYEVFLLAGWPMLLLQQGATVLSKMASDTVAALIEGFADKSEFLRMRHWDYQAKLNQLFACYARLEVLLPEEEVLDLLHRPKNFMENIGSEARELEKFLIANALDLLYLWMYQPRARSTLARLIPSMTPEERAIFVHTQWMLTRVQEVSQMFVNGLVGSNFARPLAFYLGKYEEYLKDISALTGICPVNSHTV